MNADDPARRMIRSARIWFIAAGVFMVIVVISLFIGVEGPAGRIGVASLALLALAMAAAGIGLYLSGKRDR